MANGDTYTIEEVALAECDAVGIRDRVKLTDLPQFFGSAYEELDRYIHEEGADFAGPPFARYPSMPEEGAVDIEAVFPVTKPLKGKGRVRPIHFAATKAAQTIHTGPYAELGSAYDAVERWVEAHHRERADAPREVYLTGPEVPEAQHQTLVVQPIR